MLRTPDMARETSQQITETPLGVQGFLCQQEAPCAPCMLDNVGSNQQGSCLDPTVHGRVYYDKCGELFTQIFKLLLVFQMISVKL